MDEKTTESSVEFSLNQLMEIESDRARKEENAKVLQAADQARAQAEVELRTREAEELRIATEDQKRREEEQKRREADARVAAVREGEVEKARLDADNAARLEQMKVSQDHERKKLLISQDEEKQKLRKIAGLISIALVAVALVGGIGAFKLHSAKQADELRHAEELRAANEQISSFQRKLAEQEGVLAQKVAAFGAAKDEVERNAAAEALRKAQEEVNKTKENISAVKFGKGKVPVPGKAVSKKTNNCAPGDPLCSSIP